MADPLRTKFIVAPITTALQQVARKDARAFVVIALADDDFVDFDALREELAGWPGRQHASVFFSVRLGLPSGQPFEIMDGMPSPCPVFFQQTDVVRLVFEGIARDTGFRRATVEAYLPSECCDWEHIVAEFVGHADADLTAEESPVGDELVEVYPIRTAMSRFENLGADYAIRIVPAIHELNSTASNKIPEAIEAHLSKFQPSGRRKIAFMVTTTKPGPKTEAGLHLLIDNNFWSIRLGFEVAGFRHI
jgi:hypothetical protein